MSSAACSTSSSDTLPSGSHWVAAGGSADQSGALAAVSAKPGGSIALWAGVIALLIMALWRLTETALGRSTDPKSQGTMSEILDRAKAFALAVVYCGFAYSTLGFARSSREIHRRPEFRAQCSAHANRQRHCRTHRRRRHHRRRRRISHLQGRQPQLSRRSQRHLQRSRSTTRPHRLHRKRPRHRRRRACWSSSRQVFPSPTKPPDSTVH